MAQKTDPQLEAQLDAAEARGQDLMTTAVRAAEARYDHATGRVTLELTNGCAYAFPAQLVQDLNGATDDQLADVEVDGLGFNLHWPALDADLYVPALVSGMFGTRDWMTRELARHAGRTKSVAKAEAARVNGAKGGRPRKVA